jgi:hypothetical protein
MGKALMIKIDPSVDGDQRKAVLIPDLRTVREVQVNMVLGDGERPMRLGSLMS